MQAASPLRKLTRSRLAASFASVTRSRPANRSAPARSSAERRRRAASSSSRLMRATGLDPAEPDPGASLLRFAPDDDRARQGKSIEPAKTGVRRLLQPDEHDAG